MKSKVKTLADVDLGAKITDKDEYKERLHQAQLRMLLIQRKMYEKRLRAVIGFEGWDAAGKGGSIRRLVEYLDPRGFVVHPIGAPQGPEKDQHYLWRFWTKLPGPGCIGMFDRTWYGRVLVERVEGFAKKPEWQRAFGEIRAFEQMLVDDGVPLVKVFLHISQEEQLARFKEREENPFKNWKIGPEDWRNRDKWDEYVKAADEMFSETSTKSAPWHILSGERKWHTRVAVAEQCVESLSTAFGIDTTLPKGWRKLAD